MLNFTLFAWSHFNVEVKLSNLLDQIVFLHNKLCYVVLSNVSFLKWFHNRDLFTKVRRRRSWNNPWQDNWSLLRHFGDTQYFISGASHSIQL